MASNHCKLVPDAPNGKPSKLFLELQNHIHDREAYKRAWAFTMTDLFKSEFKDIERDENGEPTYEALAAVLNLDSILTQSEQEMNKAMDLGLVNEKGQPKEYVDASVAMAKAREFNKTAKQKIAVVSEKENGTFQVSIDENTPLSIAEADRNEARRQLNTALISLLQKEGFNVEFADDPTYYGVFDPLIAENNARNLRTVIRVAKGEAGLNALPEEVSHLILAGMKGNPLKTRVDALFTEDVVRRVLGDRYDYYRKVYEKGKMPLDERLREEAEGQVLANLLAGREVSPSHKPLLQRVWNWAKRLFGKMEVSDIDNAVINAQNALRPIQALIESGEVDTVLDKEQIMAHEKMYDLADETQRLADIAQDGETMLSKRLYILQHTQTVQDTRALRNDINATRKAIENQHYSAACYRILNSIGKDLKGLMQEADQMGHIYNNTDNLNVISAEAGLVSRMGMAVQAYEKYLQVLADLPVLIQRGQIEMDAEWATPIVALANEYLSNIRTLQTDIRRMRFDVLKQLVSLYYGDRGNKPEGFKESENTKWESVDMILSQAKEDISWWDSNLFSAGDSRNPLLNIIHNIVVRQQAKRNNKVNKLCMKMQEAEAKLHRAGYDNKFVYQYDSDGKPTGYYVSDRDFAKFERDRRAFIDSLDPEVLDYYEIQRAIEDWDNAHTEMVEVGNPVTPDGKRRMEQMPKKSIYEVKDFQKGWSQEQKDYYNALLDMKAEMDNALPVSMQNLYMAPQVRKSVTQMFDKDGKGALGTLWSKWKKDYTIVDDNEDYSKNITVTGKDGKKHILLDFAGNPIKRVPIYFVHKLEDQRDLSTDATHAMFNYITMSVNFSEMGQLADAMRLMQEHVNQNYEVAQTDGGKPLVDMFRSLGRQYEREYTKTGAQTKVVRAITEYIDREFFNDTKEELGKTKIGSKSVDKDALFNIFMRLTSVSRMGINVLSGITNATQGETQLICEAAANRHFNIKDLGWSKKEYLALLLPYMGNFNASDRHDRMYLLINQFNSGEDFFHDMQDKDFNKSAIKRVMGRGNVYFLNTMGEHYLHTAGMLAILHHEKVKRVGSNKEVSLYDCLKEVHDENGWHLELDSDIEFVDKNRAFLQNEDLKGKTVIQKSDRDALFENLSVYINKINADMHGGYSEAEKGNANRHALWRAILQFRQWMFGMYNKMYARPYYDATTGTMKEGAYYTLFKFLAGTLHDLKNMSLKMAIENNQLTAEEKKNARVAYAQASLFVVLSVICSLTKGWKDKDERNLRLLAYQMRRLNMETGALVPWPTSFIKNVFTLIQSPAAGIKTLESLSQAFDLAHLAWWSDSSYIKSGRFKGWWKPAKAVWTATPIYNIQRLIDMDDYNYMFNIFN